MEIGIKMVAALSSRLSRKIGRSIDSLTSWTAETKFFKDLRRESRLQELTLQLLYTALSRET